MTRDEAPQTANVTWDAGTVTRAERWRRLGRMGATLWFTGLSGSGKSTVAAAVELSLVERGVAAYRLDGDNLRHGLNADLGFSSEDRQENIRRTGEVAKLFADAGLVTLVSFISPFRRDRARCRSLHEAAGLSFLEIFVDAPLELCEARDPKGLYRRARAGEIADFTGVGHPYEVPEDPALQLRGEAPVSTSVTAVLTLMQARGLLPSNG